MYFNIYSGKDWGQRVVSINNEKLCGTLNVMKLYCSMASPYVRKVLVMAHEVGLMAQLECVNVMLSPVTPHTAVSSRNPLGKIPVLELADGTQLYDSRVICEYLDTLHPGSPLTPLSGPLRWQVLRQQALADGILDAGVVVRYETFLRPEPMRWPDWIKGHCEKITRGLAALESEALCFLDFPNLGQIATAVTVGWLDFRQPLHHYPTGAIEISEQYPQLWRWYQDFKQRPSMVATTPS